MQGDKPDQGWSFSYATPYPVRILSVFFPYPLPILTELHQFRLRQYPYQIKGNN